MSKLSDEYIKLIALGIDSSANLPDLNDMTDRGKYPMKPWTAAKTVGTIALIKKYNIDDEETFVARFQEDSKIPLEVLTDQVFENQLVFFGGYKYDKATIFKYTYCCVVVNSLQGNSTEKKFDSWAKSNGLSLREPDPILDQKFHTDRLSLNAEGNVIAFISIKPNSFSNNFLQYQDVFAGLQAITNYSKIPWIIYYRQADGFSLIEMKSLSEIDQKKFMSWSVNYSTEEINQIVPILEQIMTQ